MKESYGCDIGDTCCSDLAVRRAEVEGIDVSDGSTEGVYHLEVVNEGAGLDPEQVVGLEGAVGARARA